MVLKSKKKIAHLKVKWYFIVSNISSVSANSILLLLEKEQKSIYTYNAQNSQEIIAPESNFSSLIHLVLIVSIYS